MKFMTSEECAESIKQSGSDEVPVQVVSMGMYAWHPCSREIYLECFDIISYEYLRKAFIERKN